jgi:hypothetical protein
LKGLDREARRNGSSDSSERTQYYEQARIVIETDEQDVEALAKPARSGSGRWEA